MLDNLNMFFGKEEPLALTTAMQYSDPQGWMPFMGRGPCLYVTAFLQDVAAGTTLTFSIQQTDDITDSPTWVTMATVTATAEMVAAGVIPVLIPSSFKDLYIRIGVQASVAGGTIVMGVSTDVYQPYVEGLYIDRGRQF